MFSYFGISFFVTPQLLLSYSDSSIENPLLPGQELPMGIMITRPATGKQY